ncbi:MAG: hypothetical protein H6707_14445 [Deltaproteobacteria bacterium]|nr:hypothetical protein [Deltaproteobacteria bacterium]
MAPRRQPAHWLIVLGLLAIGGCSEASDPLRPPWLSQLCDKIDACGGLEGDLARFFGRSTAECNSIFAGQTQPATADAGTGAPCSVDIERCVPAYQRVSCVDFRAGRAPSECGCLRSR